MSNKVLFTYILLLVLILALIIGFISDWIHTNNSISTIEENGVITKIEMKISSVNVLKDIIIIDSKQLDSINSALKEAQKINVPTGGIFNIWAYVFLYKNGKKIEFMIQDSPYYGWMIVIGNKTFNSSYMFRLVETYCDK